MAEDRDTFRQAWVTLNYHWEQIDKPEYAGFGEARQMETINSSICELSSLSIL